MPNAIKPIFIFIADEGFYEKISKKYAKKFARVDITQHSLDTRKVFENLKEKYSVYILKKRYFLDDWSHSYEIKSSEEEIYTQWLSCFEKDRIIRVEDSKNAVDFINGIVAKEYGVAKKYSEQLLSEKNKGDSLEILYRLNIPLPKPSDNIPVERRIELMRKK